MLAALVTPGWGHDAFEITADARLRADVLELRVAMAPSTAMRFLTAGAQIRAFDPEHFERLRPRLAEKGRSLFSLTTRNGPLKLRRVDVSLGRELDVEFALTYALPIVTTLRFDALHIRPMPDDYGTVLTVHGRGGELLGQKLLGNTDPSLEVKIPAVSSAALREN